MNDAGYEEGVWVVQEDTSPDFQVLGICATSEEADEVAERMQSFYPDGVIYTFYPFGYRSGEGVGGYLFPSADEVESDIAPDAAVPDAAVPDAAVPDIAAE